MVDTELSNNDIDTISKTDIILSENRIKNELESFKKDINIYTIPTHSDNMDKLINNKMIEKNIAERIKTIKSKDDFDQLIYGCMIIIISIIALNYIMGLLLL